MLLAASRMRMKENPKFASAASVRAKRRRLNSGFRRQMRSAPGLSQQKPRCSQPTTAECAAADLPSRSNGRANRSAASPPAIPPAPANASPQAATFELRVANLARTQVVVFAHLGVPAPLLVQQRPWCAHLAQRNRAVSRCTRLAGPQPNVQLCTQLTQRCLPIGIRSFPTPGLAPDLVPSAKPLVQSNYSASVFVVKHISGQRCSGEAIFLHFFPDGEVRLGAARRCAHAAACSARVGGSGCQRRSSRSRVSSRPTSLRMTATRATLCGLPRARSRS